MEQSAQSLLIPGAVQGQAGWGLVQGALQEGVPVPGRKGWNQMVFKVPSKPTFYDLLQICEAGKLG